MAGEHGRGFAVVADEIRLLAERSTESTKRIATLVKSIQGDTYEAVVAMEDSTQEVVKGSQLADDAGRSLNSIYSAVERQAQMIESIAHAANEQAAVSEAVAVAMGQISEITRQTNVGTQEAAASVSYLAELQNNSVPRSLPSVCPIVAMMSWELFPGMTSMTELQGGNGSQFFPSALGPGAENNWARDYTGNYPPLSEPGRKSGSLVALSSRNGQFSFNNQQDFNQSSFSQSQGFGGQQSFAGQPSFGGQQDFSQKTLGNQQSFAPSFDNQQGFGGQPSFGNPQGLSGQQSFGNQYQQGFSGQQSSEGHQAGFDDFGRFERQQGFNDQQQFGAMPGYTGQGQPNNPASNPGIQPPNSGSLHNQQPGQSQASRQRWQRDAQQNQSQSHFGQDQAQFPNDGQFGQ